MFMIHIFHLFSSSFFSSFFFFFFNDTATTEIYTLTLHDALPICGRKREVLTLEPPEIFDKTLGARVFVDAASDRKSTRLNSSHVRISYAVFCLKKKKKKKQNLQLLTRKLLAYANLTLIYNQLIRD